MLRFAIAGNRQTSRAWSVTDHGALRALLSNGVQVPTIAVQLARSPKAIRVKIFKLGIRLRPLHHARRRA